jgi:hypothetical protein
MDPLDQEQVPVTVVVSNLCCGTYVMCTVVRLLVLM